ncbi:MAG: hypothetical protein KDE48_00650, partial [Anaerolineales bacterium]|nr:hypothetical protein [Anaerolineales bacterium]
NKKVDKSLEEQKTPESCRFYNQIRTFFAINHVILKTRRAAWGKSILRLKGESLVWQKNNLVFTN